MITYPYPYLGVVSQPEHPWWKHTTSENCYKEPDGVDLFNDEQVGFTSIYVRFKDGTRFPARTVDMSKKKHAKSVLGAWAKRGVVNDYRK